MAGFFRKNLGLKLLSVLIAISLEIYFMSPQNLVTETYSANVELEGLPSGYRIVWPPAAADGLVVAIRVRGPGPLVQEVRNTPRKLKVIFPPDPPRVYLAELDVSQLRLPSGVSLLELQPARLQFRIEPVVERSVNVRLNFTGQPPQGFTLDSWRIEPVSVPVRGPESEVSIIEALETEAIDLSQLRQTTLVDVAIRAPGGLSELSRRSVRAVLHIQVPQGEKSFSEIPFEISIPEGVEIKSVSPRTIKVSLSGDERLLKGISELSVTGTVEESAIAAKPTGRSFREQVALSVENLPAGVKVGMISPEKVEVTLVRRAKQ
jgi:YbbR domain-containing protein